MVKKRAGQERQSRSSAAGNLAGGGRVKDALRESESRFQTVVQAAPIPVVISRVSDGLVLHANELLGRTFGLPFGELIGRKTPDFYYDPADRQALLDLLERDGYVREYEVRAKKADGTSFWVVASIQTTTFDGEPALLAAFYDITERKRAEVALRESEERYRALVETSPDGISLTDLEGRVLYCNKQALALLGFESMQEVLGTNSFDLIAPEDRQRAVDNAQETLKMKSLSQIEYTLIRKDGSRVPVELGASVVVDAEGKPKGFIGVVRNITARKRAEEVLRESEARNRALLEAIPDMMFRKTRDGIYLEFIPGKELEPLVPPDEFLGKSAYEVLPEEVAKQSAHYLDLALQTGKTQVYEYQLQGNDETRYYESRIVACGKDEVLAIERDITERKRAEEALRDSEERFRKIFVEGPLGMAVVGLDYRLVRVNQTLCRMLRYSEAELTALTFPDITHPEDIDAEVQLAERVFSGEIPHYKLQKRFIRQDGETVWGSMTASVIRDERGNPLYGLGMVEDITDRKRAEEALQEARDELESRVESQMQRANTYGLTFRELTVIHLVAAGKSDKEIGTLLGISSRTANKHVQNILTKMGASSRTESGVRAVREGLVD